MATAKFSTRLPDAKPMPLLSSRLLIGSMIAAAVLIVNVGSFGKAFFQRNLISFDDRHFIEPLRGVSLHEYLWSWVPSGNRDAYPVKDLTYVVDFGIGRALGWNTFWLTNVILFLACVWLVARIARTVSRGRTSLLGVLLLAGYALHPLQTQVLQWAINRKHLLVLLFILLSFERVLALRRQRRAATTRDFAVQFALSVLGLLSFPSGVLWFSFVLLLLRRDWLRAPRHWIWPALNVAVVSTYIYRIVTHHSGYSSELAKELPIGIALENAFAIVGRAAYNVIFPFSLSIYYNPRASVGYVGIAMVLVLAGALWLFRRSAARVDTGASYVSSTEMAVGAFMAILPSCLITVRDTTEFIFADRYLFSALPFVFLLLVRGSETLSAVVGSTGHRSAVVTVLPVIVFTVACAGESAWQSRLWFDAVSVLDHCAAQEGNPRCQLLAIEKSFDAYGCATVQEKIERAKPTMRALSQWHELKAEVPFYESLCVAMNERVSLQAREQRIRELQDEYRSSCSTGFARVLVAGASAGPRAGLETAKETYLKPGECTLLSRKVANVLRAQLTSLCAASNDRECGALMNGEVSQAALRAGLDLSQANWAKGITTSFVARGAPSG